jgi:uncharacterized metal-binding protein YceD (DUF177 family)
MSTNSLKEYQIPFLGLKPGKHEYEYVLNHAFFDQFESSDIQQSDIQALIVLEKQSTMILIDFNLDGEILVSCDRCGEPMAQILHTQQRLVVKFGEETDDSMDDMLILGPAEFQIDLSRYLFEFAQLSMPAKNVHVSQLDCNQDTLAALEKHSIAEAPATTWAALKDLDYEDPEDRIFLEEEE